MLLDLPCLFKTKESLLEGNGKCKDKLGRGDEALGPGVAESQLCELSGYQC